MTDSCSDSALSAINLTKDSPISIALQRLLLELHFSAIPARLAAQLTALALQRSRAEPCCARQLRLSDWQLGLAQCYEAAAEQECLVPEANWRHWQQSLGKAETKVAELMARSPTGVLLPLIIYGTKEYPEALYRLYRPPFLLFARGNTEFLATKKFSGFAICGSRKVSLRGRSDAYALACGVSATGGFQLVSGLSEGIELAACEGMLQGALQVREEMALKAKIAHCPVIGVLSCGLDAIAPPEARQMAARILSSGGLLLSEYPAHQPRQRYTFLQRNRILAALAASLIMAELGPKSKAFNLVDYALELNHDVAVLGDSAGAQRLREQGCSHWPDAPSLLRALGLPCDWKDDILHRHKRSASPENGEGRDKGMGSLVAKNMQAELLGHKQQYLGRAMYQSPDSGTAV